VTDERSICYLDETLGKIIVLYYLNFMILTVGKHFVHKYL